MTDAALLVDRFVSASSATDAHDSLDALLNGLKSNEIAPEAIWEHMSVLQALLQVLTSGSYKEMALEEGPSLVCRIYQELWKEADSSIANKLLKEPSPGILLQSLLDVVCNNDQGSSNNYTRVLSLQLLDKIATKAPSLAQSQLLEIPNGLHRLADILREQDDVVVRNELLGGVSQKVAKWPSCGKIWVFSEVCDTLLEIAIQEGGLTGASVLVGDVLTLVTSLLSVDTSLADLIWQSPIVAPKLAQLLDLRGGTEFVNPASLKQQQQQVSQADDLDDILATGNQTTKEKEQTTVVLPKLTFQEEDIVSKVLHILGLLLDKADLRPSIWKQHSPLCSLVWELALITPPPRGMQPVCALPSPKLQQVALECTSQYFHDSQTMKQHHGMDRLMYLVCTGGTTVKWEEKLGLSQAALHVLRQTLPEEEAREILTHTLAPPMTTDDKPPPPTVVKKLLNTVFENMAIVSDESSADVVQRRRINLLGALGALSVFLQSPTDREVLLGITSSAQLVDSLLQCLEKQEDEIISLALLKFASEWIVEAPTVVQAFLASSNSVVLSVLLTRKTVVGTMVGYLLGLFMEYMANGEDEKHGGWTKQSILVLFQKKKGGISGYTTDLESLKSNTDLPWRACELEWKRFLKWYSKEVLAIRRCVVHELTSTGGDETDEEGDENGNEVTSGTSSSHHSSVKSLNRLVSQQAAELETLRISLSEGKATIEAQEGELAVWKRRVESTPTQLDDMLTEYTNKNAEMEKEVSSLKKQLEETKESVQSQLQERDNQIVELQATVQECRDRELKSRQERDDLRGELQGITSAYATLEQEYHRREGPSAQGTAAAAPTGEASDARPAQQPEGEVSHQEQSTSPELATMRTENTRLRADAAAADEWMAMAVQRMNDLGAQNQALQHEVTTLREQWQQAELTGGVVAPVVTGITQEQLDEERRQREQVEQILAESRAANSRLETDISTLRQQFEENAPHAADSGVIDELRRRLAEEESLRQDLESQLQNAQKDTATAMDSLGGSKSEKEHLERTLANMDGDLQSARSEIALLRDERDRLQQMAEQAANLASVVEEKDTLLASNESQLESMRSIVASKDEELVGLRQHLSESRDTFDGGEETNQEVISLRNGLEETRKELQGTAARLHEEIQKRDERIRELESMAPQNSRQSGSGGADSHDDEIKALRDANAAAQEWMAKAVEHHEMLQQQVIALTEDKEVLTTEIKELQESASEAALQVPDASRETIAQLERDLSERTTEATDLGARIIKLESEVRIKETEIVSVQDRIAQCEQLQSQVITLEDARDAELEKNRSLEETVSQVVSEKEELSSQLVSLRQELDEKELSIAASTGASSDEVASLRQLLQDREAELDALREELESAKDAFADADQLRITLQNARDESSRLRTVLEGAQTNLVSMQDKTASFEQLQTELQTLRETAAQEVAPNEASGADKADMDRLRDEIASSKVEVESLTVERDNLKETVGQLESQLSEFQTWADAAQLKIAELQKETEAVEEPRESERGIDNVSVGSQPADAVVTLTTERDALKGTVSALESQLSEFQIWSEAAQLKITELQTEKEAAEKAMLKDSDEGPDVATLGDEIASLKSKLASATTERDDLKEAVAEMETQLAEFQSWSDSAQAKLKELEDEKESVEQEIQKLSESRSEADSAMEQDLRNKITSSESEIASLTAERDTLKETVAEMETQLAEFQSWSDSAQAKLKELEDEKESVEQEMKKLSESRKEADSAMEQDLRDKITSSESEIASLTAERDTLKETVAEMETQLAEFQTWSDSAQEKLKEVEDEKEALEEETRKLLASDKEAENAIVDGLRGEIASLTTERDTLKETIAGMETQLAEFQTWSDAAQLKITELQDEKDTVTVELDALAQSEKDAKEQLDTFRENLELKSSELSIVQQENDELKTVKADLDSQLERTKLENDNLYGKNSSLEQDLKVLETQCNDLVDKSTRAEAAVNEKEEALRDVEMNAAELQSALETLQAESTGVVDEWKAQVEELESTVAELEEALQQQQVEASDAVEQWSARWSELDSLKSDLERHLETVSKERDDLSGMLQHERENGGKEALAQAELEHTTEKAEWEAEKECMQTRIDEQNESLLVSSQSVTAANEELSQMRKTAEETVEAWKHRATEMEDTIQELEQELAQRRDEASEAIAQWESHCGTVEARVEELERELQAVTREKDEVRVNMEKSIEPLGEQLEEERAARARLEKEHEAAVTQIEEIKTQSEDIIDQWKERVQELESSVVELEGQLEVQQEEATKAISQWESSYETLGQRAFQLEEDLARAAGEADQSMNEELRGRQEEIDSLRDQIDELQKTLVDHDECKERARELEMTLETERENLRVTEGSLESKRALAETLETELLQLREEVESDVSETRAALVVERAARELAEKNLATLQETVSETEEAFDDLRSKEEQIFSASTQSKEAFEQLQKLLETKESEWTTEQEGLIQERDDLKAAVGELQEELRDASDALQACVTDEISEKATEVASEALRSQMERLRSQIERDQELCAREREARMAAEKEVATLKSDLANVLGVIGDREDASSRVQRMTMRASETMQRREREEMEEVRKALERALQDLASAQAAESKALEDAASSRLQLSVCEQEILAARSDLAFLTQTLEETREAEASKAASLEYRISSLEDDRDVLRQFHQDELENLRLEVTHVNMEKDRILHSLKESEKKNAAIVFSTSKKRESDGSDSPEAELSRLRVEKAQLLTAAAEEGSRTESRIREAVAAHVSSMEADVILEKELRVAAERRVEDIKFQMEELKSAAAGDDESREPSGGNVDDSRSESFLDELSAELKEFKEQTRSLSAENAALKEELLEATEKSKAEIVELTDKWRMAQAKAHKLEASGLFDAEVNVEVAKLRSNGGGEEPRNWLVVHENPAEDDGRGLSPVAAYDLIQQQKIAIQEERAMYLELLAEHDDLLALLAQQDLEKSSLNAALSRVAGTEAVDAAMLDAEENAVKQFGKYVKLSS